MPAGYIESKKILFHKWVAAHQTCDMNQLQESHGHWQISARKPLGRPIRFRTALGEQPTLE
jgi:hypothetical protein